MNILDEHFIHVILSAVIWREVRMYDCIHTAHKEKGAKKPLSFPPWIVGGIWDEMGTPDCGERNQVERSDKRVFFATPKKH